MTKKFLAIILAACLVLCMSTTAFAADGTAADGSVGSGTANPSTGAATITHDGANFQAENDDDAVAKAEETSADGADISVWGKIVESGETSGAVIYKLDVAWGAMQFEFNRGAGVWNPETHSYSVEGATDAVWTADYLNGTNNKITVTNHTNSAIDATFVCALDAGAFNEEAGADAVVGNFFETNEAAVTAAEVLTAVDGVANKLTDSKITLETAVAYSSDGTAEGNVAAGARADDAFFAFSGTPDTDITKSTFAKVGTITITFAENTKDYQAFVAE